MRVEAAACVGLLKVCSPTAFAQPAGDVFRERAVAFPVLRSEVPAVVREHKGFRAEAVPRGQRVMPVEQ
eukprot:8462907-Lingulodinium_polyedra.AAC.1